MFVLVYKRPPLAPASVVASRWFLNSLRPTVDMKEIILQIICYVAALAIFVPWPKTSAGSTIFTPPPTTIFNRKGTPCEGIRCASRRHCALDENTQAVCVCDANCNNNFVFPVCGSDNKTYPNDCALTLKACMTNSNLTTNYNGQCTYEASMCNGFPCPLNRVCAVAGNRAICVCTQDCPTNIIPVCGTDNQTYINDCDIQRHACLTNKTITIDNYAECKQATPCDGFPCPTGMKCAIDDRKRPVCVCADKCPYAIDKVCGTDGRTYGSECEVYRSACITATSIGIAYKGYCLNGSVCSGFRCSKNKLCNVNQDNKPVCVCSQSCPIDIVPVCGSDGVTYPNLCSLEKQACTTATNLTMVRTGQCSYTEFCFGVFCQYPKTCVADAKNQTSCACNKNCGKDYYPVCGSDNKTYDNYCWFVYGACQRNLSTNFYTGVCSSGSGCQGSIICPFGQHCDSLRQSKPKCVCDTVCPKTYSPVCGSNNKTYNNSCELQKDACLTNTTIWANSDGKCPGCTGTYCDYGRVCAVDEHYRPMCVCSQDCAAGLTDVCGTENKTYSNECFLRAAACMTNKTVAVQSYELCKKDGACNDVVCPSDRYCTLNTNGKPNCVCNDQCISNGSPVCGSDKRTYSNLCELQKKACTSSSSIHWLYYGACVEATVCDKISCPPDKRCAIDERNRSACVCFDQCLGGQDFVCGSDGYDYNNECEMQKSACLSNRKVTTKYRGKCDTGLTCSDISCPTGRVCAMNEKNLPTCVCNTDCSADLPDPICGTDGKTYTSSCHLLREACTKNKNIALDYTGSCTSVASSTTTKRPCIGSLCKTTTTTLMP